MTHVLQKQNKCKQKELTVVVHYFGNKNSSCICIGNFSGWFLDFLLTMHKTPLKMC